MIPPREAIALGLVCAGLWLPAAASAQVTSADQICSPTTDPCTITTSIATGPGAVLDFGDRELIITLGGSIDADINDLTIRCGKLTINTNSNVTAIELRGQGAFDESEGGLAIIEVQRRCSLNNAILCTKNFDCSLANPPAGSCSIGRGDALVSGKISGSAQIPGSLILRAAGNVTVDEPITMNVINIDESDGGTIDIEAGGSIVIDAKLNVDSGGLGTGGDVCLNAGGDINLNDQLIATGGDLDGGLVEIAADGNITITDDINCRALSGEGFGGELAVTAGGDLTIVGGGAGNRLTINTDGHESSELFGGDGGAQEYTAGGDIVIGEFVKMSAVGAPPDGFGEEVLLDAGGDVMFEGDVDSKGVGQFAGGGSFTVFTSGDVEITSKSKIDLTGPSAAGDAEISSLGNINIAGEFDITTGGDGVAGSADFDSGAGLVVEGDVTIGGQRKNAQGNLVPVQSLDLRACYIDVKSTANLDNRALLGRTKIAGRETINIRSGAKVFADQSGSNEITYRNPLVPPAIQGNVNPAAQISLDASLSDCPVCGDGTLQSSVETCDDGNVNPGDGCTADCQAEACIADTPGYPQVALCDDGDGCTVDTCDAATGCSNVVCPDGGFCNEILGVCEMGTTLPTTTSTTTTSTTSTTLSGGGFCGDGAAVPPEQCDDGDSSWATGEFCSATCTMLACGDPDNSGSVVASDALVVLRAAVGAAACDACVCNVDGAGSQAFPVTASDALRVLQFSVQIPVQFNCPACLL